ncbi:MAG TPA: ATP-binding protein [Pseudomonadales bacterium]|nr:ATP-binding protein [Pseudomonadales bacterium]
MQLLLQAYLLPLLLAIIAGIWIYAQRQRTKATLAEWEDAYRNIEAQLEDRTQKLRSINNMLYGEIAQHEQTEEKLRKAQDYLGSIINSMPSVLVSVTAAGQITHWNTSAERATNMAAVDVAGKLLWDAYPNLPITLATIQQSISDGTPTVMESAKLESHGQTYYTDITIYPLIAENIREAVIRVDDVTMRLTMENMMIQNEKMLSLGELAAGMAHEINNPLGAILQSVQNIERRLSPELPKNFEVANNLDLNLVHMNRYLQEREIPSFLKTIRDAGERSARIVSNMLGFSRSSQQHNPTDLNTLITNCLELVENQFEITRQDQKTNIELEKHLLDNMPVVSCSAPEIQQVLLNIIRNASQALAGAESPSPRITISTGCDTLFAWIKITDNGPGITPEIRRHLFEPFFTTKEVGQGTGLGMSISYFIITRHHGGSIDVDSTPGEGASFTIRLPLTRT